jgi:hypothetical protein
MGGLVGRPRAPKQAANEALSTAAPAEEAQANPAVTAVASPPPASSAEQPTAVDVKPAPAEITERSLAEDRVNEDLEVLLQPAQSAILTASEPAKETKVAGSTNSEGPQQVHDEKQSAEPTNGTITGNSEHSEGEVKTFSIIHFNDCCAYHLVLSLSL